MSIVQLIIVALIVEAIWETSKMLWQAGKVNWDRVGSIVLGILLAFGAKVDFMAIVGIPLVIPYLGYVLTGLLISRGSNFVHDLWISIQSFSAKSANIMLPPLEDTPQVNKVVKKIAKVLHIQK